MKNIKTKFPLNFDEISFLKIFLLIWRVKITMNFKVLTLNQLIILYLHFLKTVKINFNLFIPYKLLL